MWFEALALVSSVIAGGSAAVTGFGIGSLLTPTASARQTAPHNAASIPPC